MSTPTRAGQFVTNHTGNIGITTDTPAVRTPTIPVQWQGHSHPVREQLHTLTVIQVAAL